MSTIPGGQYGTKITHLDDHCRWMMRAGKRDNTVKKRRMYMQYLGDFLRKDPFAATEADLERWQDSLPRHSIRQATTIVQPYYKWVHAKGYRPDNPAALLVMPKARKGLPRPVTFEQFQLVLSTAPARLVPYFLLAAYAGLRAFEIAPLDVSDFIVTDASVFIHLRETKGGDERVTAIPLWLWPHLRSYMPESGPCWKRGRGVGPVTESQISQACNKHIHALGITDRTFHSFRHWTGTSASEHSDDLLVIQTLMGHRNPQSTNVYAFVRPKRVAALVEQFPRVEVPDAG